MLGTKKLDELAAYQQAMELSRTIWNISKAWSVQHQKTLGNQLIRAVDSISANISEGFGRQSAKSNRQFCYFARGSLFETRTWLQKAVERGLIKPKEHQQLNVAIQQLLRCLDSYIRFLTRKQ